MSKQVWYSIDPGATGGAAKWIDRELVETFEFNSETYKKEFENNKEYKPFIVLEYITTVFNGAFASFKLSQSIGFIKGLAYANNIEVIEKGNTPKEWKKPWSEILIKKKGEKWKNGEAKQRSINLVKELYPNAKISKIEHMKTKDKEVYLDGICDAILIGRSFIERGLIDNYL